MNEKSANINDLYDDENISLKANTLRGFTNNENTRK